MTAMVETASVATGEVIENLEVAPLHFRIKLRLPSSLATPEPGQFVMIREPGHGEPLLPRPLSVYGFTRDSLQTHLELLYRVAGRGTALFSGIKPGSLLTVLGPLGRGFTLERRRQVILLAGGVGVAPLTYLLGEGEGQDERWKGTRIRAYVGARTSDFLAGLERLQGVSLCLATDDGTAGYHGLVTDLLRRDLGDFEEAETMIYACGPTPMLRSLAGIVANTAMDCQVSLEERMACGIGACLGCAVAVRNGKEGHLYRRVCHEGPVFDIRELLWRAAGEEEERETNE